MTRSKISRYLWELVLKVVSKGTKWYKIVIMQFVRDLRIKIK